jgi:glycosyltransferase involved in cell wall biosynthesis
MRSSRSTGSIAGTAANADAAVKALLVIRPDASSTPGGDLVHAQRTATALRGLGVEADVVSTGAPNARGYDVAHVFGVFEPALARRQIDAVRERGVPLVLSPIWLDLRGLFAIEPLVERALGSRTLSEVKQRLAKLRRFDPSLVWRGRAAHRANRRLLAQRELVATADVLLPASNIEAYLYGALLRVSDIPFIVAPLGVDDDAFGVQRRRVRAGVLCAARIEPKKNQAALLYALHDVDVELTLVGTAADERYFALCRRWATPRTRFVDHVDHDQVLRMMSDAAVHALPSWHETPGLASLEAAATGARLVTGDRGCEREYFGPDVDYADPADPVMIRAAVLRALDRGPRERGDALERRLGAYTWQRNGQATLAAYTRAAAARA